MECPPQLRGNLYDTKLVQRCLAHRTCSTCKMCTNFDAHSAACQFCEGRKPKGEGHHCRCLDRHRDLTKRLGERIGQPVMPLPGQKTGSVEMQIPLDSGNESLHQEIKESFASLGSSAKVIEE